MTSRASANAALGKTYQNQITLSPIRWGEGQGEGHSGFRISTFCFPQVRCHVALPRLLSLCEHC